MKIHLQPGSMLPLVCTLVLTAQVPAPAAQYLVNRSWTDGVGIASLAGTVDVPIGSYAISNGAPNPFTAVNLTLTVNGTPFSLDFADTSMIFGSGSFFIDATGSNLNFTASGNGSNPADLAFKSSVSTALYGIGSDGNPAFEVAYTSAGDVIGSTSWPTTFGVVPESSSLALAGLGAALVLIRRRR